MALEAVVFQQDLFGHSTKDLYNLLGGTWCYDNDFGLNKQQQEYTGGCGSSFDFLQNQTENNFLHVDWTDSSPPFSDLQHQINPSLDANNANNDLPMPATTSTTRPRRRRSRTRKNKEEIENQRMTHITVERNRRKQMNEYLSVLRSLMPESYVQRGDQASIIGGAINFVKELEQRLQFLGAQKEIKEKADGDASSSSLPFSDFFTFPQFSTTTTTLCENNDESQEITQSTIADIEVNMIDSHANLKIRSRRRPKQLLKVVSGLHSMRLTILHLNVTTVDQIVLYSLSVKVEDDCKLTSVDEIATALYQLLGRIQEEEVEI